MFMKFLAILLLMKGVTLFAEPILIPAPTPIPSKDICEHQDSSKYPGCVQTPAQISCQAYNRDGITCEQVDMYEGEIAAPWGTESGLFQCVNGCLHWVEQSKHCKAYNRDGVTCQQVKYHEGQIGHPWGKFSGKFRCEDGCLKFIWWW